MNLFALDSSTSSASVAILSDGVTLFSHTADFGLTHSETLMTVCDEAFVKSDLKPTQIDYFVICNGPGSYTGVRIGLSVIKGFALAADRPCIAVGTLETIASAQKDGTVAVLLDARRDNFFCAVYEVQDGIATEILPPSHMSTQELLEFTSKEEYILSGNGAELFFDKISEPERLRYTLSGDNMPRAEVAARIAQKRCKTDAISATEVEAEYVRAVKIG